MQARSSIALVLVLTSAGLAQSGNYTAVPVPPGEHPDIRPPSTDATYDVTWSTIDGGGRSMQAGSITLDGTLAQPDAGLLTAGGLELFGGFQIPADDAPSCYANCDNSTTPPVLNINDFNCFLNRFNQGTSYANCDNSTTPPILNVVDFQCFVNKFAAGCS
jgi:hypothetical protein